MFYNVQKYCVVQRDDNIVKMFSLFVYFSSRLEITPFLNKIYEVFLAISPQLSTAVSSAQPNLVKNTDQDLSILQWAATL